MMTDREIRRVTNINTAKRAVEAAIARGDARLIGLATATPGAAAPDDIQGIIDAQHRRRGWLRVLTAKLTGNPASITHASWHCQEAIRRYPRRALTCGAPATPRAAGVDEAPHPAPQPVRTSGT